MGWLQQAVVWLIPRCFPKGWWHSCRHGTAVAQQERPEPVLCPWSALPGQVQVKQAGSGQKAALREPTGRRGRKWEGAELGKVGSTSRLSLQENNLLRALSTQLGGSPRPLMSHPALPTPGMDAKGTGSVTAGHMTPLCHGDSVLELQPHHQGPSFFPAEG